MSFKIEYLASSAVVYVKTPFTANLDGVTGEARSGGATAKTLFGADGFQIRDMSADGEVVLSESLGAR